MSTEKREPVEYIVKEKSLIGNELHEAGARVHYAGLPSENLEPTCDEGRARYNEYLKSNEDRVAKMIAANDSGAADAETTKLLAAILAKLSPAKVAEITDGDDAAPAKRTRAG